jgi:hypothetical protein
MAKVEQLSRLSVKLSPQNPFAMEANGPDKVHRLSIEEPLDFGHDTSPDAQDLMRTVMLAHLIAHLFPRTIDTNFPIRSTEFLYELYDYYGYQPPVIRKSSDQIVPNYRQSDRKNYKVIDTASTHSGGLDSAYRITRQLANGEKVLAVHLRNLNPKGNYMEAEASRRQCELWNVPYRQIKLKNSSGNTGFDTMRTRDMFLGYSVAIIAAPHRVRQVLIEGGMSPDRQSHHFSENSDSWTMFNCMIRDVGLNLEVVGVDPGDIETVSEIISLEQQLGIDILPLIQNCFSAPFQLPSNRKKWQRETPYIAENSPAQWCGSCHKCRRTTLGRIVGNDPGFRGVPEPEIAYFVRDTYDWIRKYPHNANLLSPSFLRHLKSLSDSIKL